MRSSSTQTKIADKTLKNIIDNPSDATKLNTNSFQKIAQKSSWNYGPTKNGKGYRAINGDMSIRYNLNGSRFDAQHFFGDPYWVVSSAAKGIEKIRMF